MFQPLPDSSAVLLFPYDSAFLLVAVVLLLDLRASLADVLLQLERQERPLRHRDDVPSLWLPVVRVGVLAVPSTVAGLDWSKVALVTDVRPRPVVLVAVACTLLAIPTVKVRDCVVEKVPP